MGAPLDLLVQAFEHVGALHMLDVHMLDVLVRQRQPVVGVASILCKIVDLRFQALPDEITATAQSGSAPVLAVQKPAYLAPGTDDGVGGILGRWLGRG